MGWDDKPPSKKELSGWEKEPPTKKELGQDPKPKEMGFVQSQVQELPIYGAGLGGIAGSFGGPIVAIGGAAAGAGIGQSLKDIVNRYAYGEKKGVADTFLDPAIAAAHGATAEAGGQLVGKAFGSLQKPMAKEAELFAVNATGATGAQAAKFEKDAGRQLLDRNLVKFGDSAKNIAKRVSKASDQAGKEIGAALSELDAKGVQVSQENIVKALEGKVNSLSKSASSAKVAKELQNVIDDIINTGESTLSASAGEAEKRGFRKAAGNWMNPEAGKAGKEAYLAYMKEVEDVATKASPGLGKKFIQDKETFGLLAPIKEAAERRASTLNQSPIGGLLDVATAGTMGAPAAIARRLLSPRIGSSLAVTLDQASKMSTVPMERITSSSFQRRLENLNKGK